MKIDSSFVESVNPMVQLKLQTKWHIITNIIPMKLCYHWEYWSTNDFKWSIHLKFHVFFLPVYACTFLLFVQFVLLSWPPSSRQLYTLLTGAVYMTLYLKFPLIVLNWYHHRPCRSHQRHNSWTIKLICFPPSNTQELQQ